ncbi:hypothetical protein V1478_007680 [Vespula squamosa]|uniref:Uncharacterized protein n=1 Tax=Vespula squamosa TaxID=30214 RepID=A0ABD2AZD6_VESSQ
MKTGTIHKTKCSEVSGNDYYCTLKNSLIRIFLLNHLDTLGPILVLKIQTLGIDSLANLMLFLQRYTLGSEFCELRSLLSPRFYTTLLNRKIVILYCLFQGYQHPENDSVERTAARLFWILAIGSSRLVVPTIILGFLDLTDLIADSH